MTVGLLNDTTFRLAVDAVPLVAIDLVLRRADGAVLLGLRNNRPAQDWWFVPGGRIRKGERLDSAFLRLTQAELGVPLERRVGKLLGVYEHFYDDSVFGQGGDAPSTHYVVLAHELRLAGDPPQAWPTAQHSNYRWMQPDELLVAESVHPHSKAYFRSKGH